MVSFACFCLGTFWGVIIGYALRSSEHRRISRRAGTGHVDLTPLVVPEAYAVPARTRREINKEASW